MHVVLVNQSGGLYGIERMLLALVPALRASDVRVTFIALCDETDRGAELGRQLRDAGVEVHFVPITRFIGLSPLRQLAAVLRRCAPSVVHVHGYKAAMAVALLRLVDRRPVLATVHSESASSRDMRTALRVETLCYRRFDRLVAVSQGVQQDLERRGVARERLSVIQNGIVDRFAHATMSRDLRRVVVVGRLVEVKRFDVAIRAIAALRQQGHHCTLDIVGDGPLRAELESLASTLGVAEQVRFIGFVNDVTPYLARATMFAMPSMTEGAPIALLEAMAAGCTIVASRVGGIPDIARDGEEALLIDPAHEGQLAVALGRLLDDTALRTRLSGQARKRFLELFEVGRMTARYLEAYRGLVPMER